MFEKILVRRLAGSDATFNAGLLAETVLYYGQVHLLVTHGLLVEILRDIGAKTFLRLLKSDYVHATYVGMEMIGNTEVGGRLVHFTGEVDAGRQGTSVRDIIVSVLARLGHDGTEVRRLSRELSRLMPRGQLDVDGSKAGEHFPRLFYRELQGKPDLLPEATIFLNIVLPGQLGTALTRFNVEFVPSGEFFVDTDLNFPAAHAEYRRLNPTSVDDLTVSTILVNVLGA